MCVTSYKLLLKDQAYFLRRRWKHLVLDEVQLIKNMTEKHWETIFTIKRSADLTSHLLSVFLPFSQSLFDCSKWLKSLFIKLTLNFCFNSQQRILLINNPLQNTLRELWTMIHFLLPGITRSYLDFPVKPVTDQNQDYCHKLVIRLHRVGIYTGALHFVISRK